MITSPAMMRMCPMCQRRMEAKLCPAHQIATLIVDPAEIDAGATPIGTMIAGRYVVERKLSIGAHGGVFVAAHTGTGQHVALKLLSRRADDRDLVSLQRFFLEARASSGLRHVNTVRVFDFGQDDSGLPYIAMELLAGRNLRETLAARTVFTEREAAELGIAVAGSLAEAHGAGLVHRDLKPANIFLHQLEGEAPIVKVLDFGVVKLSDNSVRLTERAHVVGTPSYMSPEQVSGLEVDARTDLYALGLILYELVTGLRPFRGTDPVLVARARMKNAAPDVRTEAPIPVSESFARIIAQSLSRWPDDRYKDARALRGALESCIASAPSVKPTAQDADDPTEKDFSGETVT